MPIPVPKLLVVANPWIEGCIDHLGRPCGRVPVDPHEHSPIPATFVGCRFADVKELESAKTFRVGKAEVPVAPARHDHRIAYSKEPVEIPNTKYYRDAISRGNLIAADKKTASEAGINNFKPPQEILAAERENAISHFNNVTGDDAHAEMGEFEPLWLPTAEEELAANAAAEAEAKATADKASADPKANRKTAQVTVPSNAPNDSKGSA